MAHGVTTVTTVAMAGAPSSEMVAMVATEAMAATGKKVVGVATVARGKMGPRARTD